MVEIGDAFMLIPAHCTKREGVGSKCEDEKAYPGTVVEIYKHGFALVDFGYTRECFPLSDLEIAPRAPKNWRGRK